MTSELAEHNFRQFLLVLGNPMDSETWTNRFNLIGGHTVKSGYECVSGTPLSNMNIDFCVLLWYWGRTSVGKRNLF